MLHPDNKFMEQPWAAFKSRFSEKQEALFEKIMVSWNSVYENYNKYDEKIESLPDPYITDKNFVSKGNAGTPEWIEQVDRTHQDLPVLKNLNVSTKYPESAQKESSILFKRHLSMPYDGCLYAEALSGAQSYFSLLAYPPDDDYSRIKLIYELLETALLDITIIDERFESYL